MPGYNNNISAGFEFILSSQYSAIYMHFIPTTYFSGDFR